MLVGKVQFECNSNNLREVQLSLYSLLGMKIASFTRGYTNYCLILRGITMSDLSDVNDLLSKYRKSKVISYYEVGHFNL